MILLQDSNIITNFAEYLKYGLAGSSAIVLILTYFLLFKEQSRTGDARENILSAIKKYMWTALLFLVISGVSSFLDQYYKNNETKGGNSVVSQKENCNKQVALYLDLKGGQDLISSSDTFVLQYRVKRSETKTKEVPVFIEQGRFKAVIDSINFDEIYWVGLVDKSKPLKPWENKGNVNVSYTSADLFYTGINP